MRYELRLFVTGRTSYSQHAIRNLKAVCEEALNGAYDLEVIDVLERPQLAEEERILATPTLVKVSPPPLRRIIGDLSHREKVMEALDLYEESRPREENSEGTDGA